MASQLAIFLCLSFVVVTLALPSDSEDRLKRDVMDSVKNAWTDAVKSVSEAGDAVVDAVKPTEKSAVDKLADGVKSLGE